MVKNHMMCLEKCKQKGVDNSVNIKCRHGMCQTTNHKISKNVQMHLLEFPMILQTFDLCHKA